ncbi:MAG: hypothetical protein ACP5NZ_02780 [Nanobdellota archaeon]
MNSDLKSLKEESDFKKFKKLFLLEFTRQLIKNSSSADISKLQTLVEKENIVQVQDTRERIKQKIRIREEEISSKYEESKIEGTRSILSPSIGMFENQTTPENNLFKNFLKKERPAPIPKGTKMLPGSFITSGQPKQMMQGKQAMSPQAMYQQRRNYEDPFKKLGFWVYDSQLPEHIQYLRPTPVNKDIDLAKLNPLINDPMVNTIECYGSEENIVVKGRMGTKKTPIILTKEEIDDIIQRFSRETKIPVQEGVFKVVAGRLILLAIISEVVGSKFVIKKMTHEEQMNQGV